MGQRPPTTHVSSAHHTLMPLLVLALVLVLVLVLVLALMLKPAHAAAAEVWLGRLGRTSGAGCFRLADLQLAPVLRSCPPSGEYQHRGRGQ